MCVPPPRSWLFSQVHLPYLFGVHDMPGHGSDMAVPMAHGNRDYKSSHLQLLIWIGLKMVWKVLGVFIVPA